MPRIPKDAPLENHIRFSDRAAVLLVGPVGLAGIRGRLSVHKGLCQRDCRSDSDAAATSAG